MGTIGGLRMDNEFDLTRSVMVKGAENFVNFFAKQHDISMLGLRKTLKEWKEQLE